MAKKRVQPTQEETDLLRKTGSANEGVARAAISEFAMALETPLRQGILDGDITDGIFEVVNLEPDAAPEFPLDFLAPGTEKDFVAYTIPNHGRIPERNVESDYVMVPTFEIGNSIDWTSKYARNARWDIVGRATQVFQAGFVKKNNDDAWHTLLGAGVDRNIIIFDSAATAGQFTKRLVSLMKTVMRRHAGGNSTSVNRGKLTDLFISPEADEDIRDWNVDQVDEVTRRQIFMSEEGTLSKIFGVVLHDLDELGEGQEYQNFFTNSLTGSLASGDVELVVGLDLRSNDSFMRPVREDLQVVMDESMFRQRRRGMVGWMEGGWAVLNSARVLLGSL